MTLVWKTENIKSIIHLSLLLYITCISWHVHCSSSYQQIYDRALTFQCLQVKFESFDVDCDDDSVDIYDGVKLITELCGTNPPSSIFSSKVPLVKFITGSVTEGSGFNFTWQQQGRCLVYAQHMYIHLMKQFQKFCNLNSDIHYSQV